MSPENVFKVWNQ